MKLVAIAGQESPAVLTANSNLAVNLPAEKDTVDMDQRSTTFHEIYSRYADDVYRFSYWLSGNSHDARDITSETFVRAWTSSSEPRLETVKSYLFCIARNLHLKQWRRSSRQEELTETMPDLAATPDLAAGQKDELGRTLAAIQLLPELDRTVLLLRAEQGLAYEEIAGITGISVATAKVKVFRARAKLNELLGRE